MINTFFEELKAISSRHEKESILRRESKNKVFKEALRLALDPMTQFYQRKIPKYKPSKKPQIDLADAMVALGDLSSRKVTGNAAIDFLKNLLESVSEDDAKVLERIIQKDPACGVQASTVNKIWKGLVHEYPCMLASGNDKKLLDKMTYPAIAQTKFDGMRFNAIVKGNKVEYRSRNGKPLNLMGYMDEEFIALSRGLDFVFDGELLVSRNGKVLPRQEGNGILNKANKGTITPAEAVLIVARIWDAIPHPQWTEGFSDLEYVHRLVFIGHLFTEDSNRKVLGVKSKVINSLDEAQDYYNELLAQGEEGIILKNVNSPWEDKRVPHQIKFKNELEADLLCVGWEEGTGKNKGKLGALILQSSDAKVNVSVGTGLTDEDRSTLTEKDVVGKIVAIKYNSRIQNTKGEDSLFLPVFLEIREDKTKADSSKGIK